MASHWKDNIVLKAVNVLAYLFASGSNLSTVVAPGKIAYGGTKETFIHPADFTFGVWGLINLLLLGYVVAQFTDAAYDTVVGVSWSFPLVLILNGLFVNLFAQDHYVLAFIASLFVASLVSQIYYTLKTTLRSNNVTTLAFVHLPFSLWHAASVVLVVVSGFSAFGQEKYVDHAGLWTKIFVIVGIVFLTSTAWAYAFGDDGRGDIAGAFVISWFILGIFLEQKKPRVIHWVALGGFIVSALAIVKSLVTTFRSRGTVFVTDEERAPLVGGH